MGKRREGETEEERKERKRLKREHKKMVKKEFSEQHGFAWGKKIDEQLEVIVPPANSVLYFILHP